MPYLYLLFTKEILENTTISVGHDQGVGAGVKVGHIYADLLVLQSGDGTHLGHEEDEVTHVNVVAQSVDDEKEVRPVLSRAAAQWSGDSFFFLFLLFRFLELLGFVFLGFNCGLSTFLDIC